MTYDLLIKDGRIIDGSGRPAFHGESMILGGDQHATRRELLDGVIPAPVAVWHLAGAAPECQP